MDPFRTESKEKSGPKEDIVADVNTILAKIAEISGYLKSLIDVCSNETQNSIYFIDQIKRQSSLLATELLNLEKCTSKDFTSYNQTDTNNITTNKNECSNMASSIIENKENQNIVNELIKRANENPSTLPANEIFNIDNLRKDLFELLDRFQSSDPVDRFKIETLKEKLNFEEIKSKDKQLTAEKNEVTLPKNTNALEHEMDTNNMNVDGLTINPEKNCNQKSNFDRILNKKQISPSSSSAYRLQPIDEENNVKHLISVGKHEAHDQRFDKLMSQERYIDNPCTYVPQKQTCEIPNDCCYLDNLKSGFPNNTNSDPLGCSNCKYEYLSQTLDQCPVSWDQGKALTLTKRLNLDINELETPDNCSPENIQVLETVNSDCLIIKFNCKCDNTKSLYKVINVGHKNPGPATSTESLKYDDKANIGFEKKSRTAIILQGHIVEPEMIQPSNNCSINLNTPSQSDFSPSINTSSGPCSQNYKKTVLQNIKQHLQNPINLCVTTRDVCQSEKLKNISKVVQNPVGSCDQPATIDYQQPRVNLVCNSCSVRNIPVNCDSNSSLRDNYYTNGKKKSSCIEKKDICCCARKLPVICDNNDSLQKNYYVQGKKKSSCIEKKDICCSVRKLPVICDNNDSWQKNYYTQGKKKSSCIEQKDICCRVRKIPICDTKDDCENIPRCCEYIKSMVCPIHNQKLKECASLQKVENECRRATTPSRIKRKPSAKTCVDPNYKRLDICQSGQKLVKPYDCNPPKKKSETKKRMIDKIFKTDSCADQNINIACDSAQKITQPHTKKYCRLNERFEDLCCDTQNINLACDNCQQIMLCQTKTTKHKPREVSSRRNIIIPCGNYRPIVTPVINKYYQQTECDETLNSPSASSLLHPCCSRKRMSCKSSKACLCSECSSQVKPKQVCSVTKYQKKLEEQPGPCNVTNCTRDENVCNKTNFRGLPCSLTISSLKRTCTASSRKRKSSDYKCKQSNASGTLSKTLVPCKSFTTTKGADTSSECSSAFSSILPKKTKQKEFSYETFKKNHNSSKRGQPKDYSSKKPENTRVFQYPLSEESSSDSVARSRPAKPSKKYGKLDIPPSADEETDAGSESSESSYKLSMGPKNKEKSTGKSKNLKTSKGKPKEYSHQKKSDRPGKTKKSHYITPDPSKQSVRSSKASRMYSVADNPMIDNEEPDAGSDCSENSCKLSIKPKKKETLTDISTNRSQRESKTKRRSETPATDRIIKRSLIDSSDNLANSTSGVFIPSTSGKFETKEWDNLKSDEPEVREEWPMNKPSIKVEYTTLKPQADDYMDYSTLKPSEIEDQDQPNGVIISSSIEQINQQPSDVNGEEPTSKYEGTDVEWTKLTDETQSGSKQRPTGVFLPSTSDNMREKTGKRKSAQENSPEKKISTADEEWMPLKSDEHKGGLRPRPTGVFLPSTGRKTSELAEKHEKVEDNIPDKKNSKTPGSLGTDEEWTLLKSDDDEGTYRPRPTGVYLPSTTNKISKSSEKHEVMEEMGSQETKTPGSLGADEEWASLKSDEPQASYRPRPTGVFSPSTVKKMSQITEKHKSVEDNIPEQTTTKSLGNQDEEASLKSDGPQVSYRPRPTGVFSPSTVKKMSQIAEKHKSVEDNIPEQTTTKSLGNQDEEAWTSLKSDENQASYRPRPTGGFLPSTVRKMSQIDEKHKSMEENRKKSKSKSIQSQNAGLEQIRLKSDENQSKYRPRPTGVSLPWAKKKVSQKDEKQKSSKDDNPEKNNSPESELSDEKSSKLNVYFFQPSTNLLAKQFSLPSSGNFDINEIIDFFQSSTKAMSTLESPKSFPKPGSKEKHISKIMSPQSERAVVPRGKMKSLEKLTSRALIAKQSKFTTKSNFKPLLKHCNNANYNSLKNIKENNSSCQEFNSPSNSDSPSISLGKFDKLKKIKYKQHFSKKQQAQNVSYEVRLAVPGEITRTVIGETKQSSVTNLENKNEMDKNCTARKLNLKCLYCSKVSNKLNKTMSQKFKRKKIETRNKGPENELTESTNQLNVNISNTIDNEFEEGFSNCAEEKCVNIDKKLPSEKTLTENCSDELDNTTTPYLPLSASQSKSENDFKCYDEKISSKISETELSLTPSDEDQASDISNNQQACFIFQHDNVCNTNDENQKSKITENKKELGKTESSDSLIGDKLSFQEEVETKSERSSSANKFFAKQFFGEKKTNCGFPKDNILLYSSTLSDLSATLDDQLNLMNLALKIMHCHKNDQPISYDETCCNTFHSDNNKKHSKNLFRRCSTKFTKSWTPKYNLPKKLTVAKLKQNTRFGEVRKNKIVQKINGSTLKFVCTTYKFLEELRAQVNTNELNETREKIATSDLLEKSEQKEVLNNIDRDIDKIKSIIEQTDCLLKEVKQKMSEDEHFKIETYNQNLPKITDFNKLDLEKFYLELKRKSSIAESNRQPTQGEEIVSLESTGHESELSLETSFEQPKNIFKKYQSDQ